MKFLVATLSLLGVCCFQRFSGCLLMVQEEKCRLVVYALSCYAKEKNGSWVVSWI